MYRTKFTASLHIRRPYTMARVIGHYNRVRIRVDRIIVVESFAQTWSYRPVAVGAAVIRVSI